MTVAEVLTEVRRLGIVLQVEEGDVLRYRAPKQVLTPELREALAASKLELVAILTANNPEVAWRLSIMQRQVPLTGPIPILFARAVPIRVGHCVSCGDKLPASRTEPGSRCEPCAHAAWLAVTAKYLGEVRV